MSTKVKDEIDLSKVTPLDHHRTAVTFNCLIQKMLEILNNFGNDMEDAIERAERSLDIAERKLLLMEAKLSTVKLDGEIENEKPTVSVPDTSRTLDVPSTSTGPESEKQEIAKEPEAESSSSSDVVLIKDDPAYSKYFRMLKLGVPEAGVVQKMASEGIDPAILHRGDEPSRLQKSHGYVSSGDSVSSFSDSD